MSTASLKPKNHHCRTAIAVALLLSFSGCDALSVPSAQFEKQIGWAGQGHWMKVDTHIHTGFTDGGHTIAEIAAKASEFGCDAIAITDHADRKRRGATQEYFDEIEAARRQFPNLIILTGLEWNVPPDGGDEHATVLMPAATELDLVEFKANFDDHGQAVHTFDRARAGLKWLESRRGANGVSPVVTIEHPSRGRDSSLELVAALQNLRSESDLVIGLSGAPGHQAGTPVGDYGGEEPTIDRWDPAAARVGDAWDQLLQAGFDVWGAQAPSDFHKVQGDGWFDYWPGQFSETWVYAPERSADGVLQALRAGAFFGVHGHIARNVTLTVGAVGLTRPARPGETIRLRDGSLIEVRLDCEIPDSDWKGTPNSVELMELIAITSDGASVIAAATPQPGESTLLFTGEMPGGGAVLRARGRRTLPDAPDLMFYTNPIRLKVLPSPVLLTASRFMQIPPRTWAALLVGSMTAVALVTGLFNRRSRGIAPRIPVRTRPRPTADGATSTRRPFLFLALACTAFAVYGSLLPFQFSDLSVDEAWRRFQDSGSAPTWQSGRIDFLVNAMLFAPVGFGWMGYWNTSPSRPLKAFLWAMFAMVWTLVFSSAVEFAQIWTPGRVASLTDVAAQLAGSAAGIVAWLVTGTRIDRFRDEFRAAQRPIDRTELALRAYFVVFILLSVIPFDLTIHPGDLWQKFRMGRIVVIPFQNVDWTAATVFKFLLDILLTIPLGMLAVTLRARRLAPSNDIIGCMLVAVGLITLVEVSQLLVYSRFTQSTDVIVGSIGALIGVYLGRRLLSVEARQQFPASPAAATPLWVALAALYLIFPCCVLWWPLDFSADHRMIQSKLMLLRQAPLDDLVMRQSFMKGLSQMIERTILFAPFGLLLGMSLFTASVWAGARPRTVLAAGVGIVFLVAASIEAGQLFIPERIPDLADVLLATGGGTLGLLTCRMILGKPRLPLETRRSRIA